MAKQQLWWPSQGFDGWAKALMSQPRSDDVWTNAEALMAELKYKGYAKVSMAEPRLWWLSQGFNDWAKARMAELSL